MAEHELELRLRAAARELDRQAPAFDLGLVRSVPRRRIRGRVVALACVVAFAGVAVAPAAVSALQRLFEVDEVSELGPLAPGVAPPFAGRSVPVDAVHDWVPFRVRMIASLGAPDDARVRDDVTGGMVTTAYAGGRILVTQWRANDVNVRITLVPVGGAAEDVAVGDVPALWIEGAARGTFTLVGADGAVHRESFEVGTGVLLWNDDAMTFLLQGAGSKADAMRLSAEVT
jgi:hypothetical protein